MPTTPQSIKIILTTGPGSIANPAKNANIAPIQMNDRMRDILAEIDRRRDSGENPCESCHATGLYEGAVCDDCLGQKILLFRHEYDAIRELGDSILDAQILE